MTWCLLATHWRSVGDWLATVSWAFVFDRRKCETFWRSVGNRSATGQRWVSDSKLCRDCLQPLQMVVDQSPTSRRPVGNLSAITKYLSTIDLVAERFHLQQPKPPCYQIVPATFCNRSATSRRPPCNRPTTSLRPPEILVARRLPTGCKLYVWPGLQKRLSLSTMAKWAISDWFQQICVFRAWNSMYEIK